MTKLLTTEIKPPTHKSPTRFIRFFHYYQWRHKQGGIIAITIVQLTVSDQIIFLAIKNQLHRDITSEISQKKNEIITACATTSVRWNLQFGRLLTVKWKKNASAYSSGNEISEDIQDTNDADGMKTMRELSQNRIGARTHCSRMHFAELCASSTKCG